MLLLHGSVTGPVWHEYSVDWIRSVFLVQKEWYKATK